MKHSKKAIQAGVGGVDTQPSPGDEPKPRPLSKCIRRSCNGMFSSPYGRWIMPDGSDGGTCSLACEQVYPSERAEEMSRRTSPELGRQQVAA